MEISPLEKISFYIRMLFMVIAAGVLIAVIAGVLIYNRQPSVKLLNERQKALELETAGDFEGAVSVMSAAAQQYPEFPAGKETLAGIYLDWGAALMRQGTEDGFTAGLEKFRLALETQDLPQIRDSAVRVILEAVPADLASANSGTDPETGSETDAEDRTGSSAERKLEQLAAAKTVFDDSRLADRENAVMSAWLTDLLKSHGDKKTVEIMQERLEADPANAAAASAFTKACAVFAANRRHSVTEENEPAEIYREMNQAVYFLHQWAVRLAELSAGAGQDTEAGKRLAGQALTLEAMAKEYDIERAGLIVKSEERIAEKAAAEAAALQATAGALFASFCGQYPDRGQTQYAIARGIQEHSGFGRGCSVYQIRSGINNDQTQTWLAHHSLDDGYYEQLIYVVDLADRSFRQTQYLYSENGEERQEERSTSPFSFMPYYNEDAFNAMLADMTEKLRTELPAYMDGADDSEDAAAPDAAEAAAADDPEAANGAAIPEENIWLSFRYFTDGVLADGETAASGMSYYRAGCIYDGLYHEFIVLEGPDGSLTIREAEPAPAG